MATFGKILMDEFYSLQSNALKLDDYEAAQVFNLAESRVNNIAHGLPTQQWFPHFLEQMEAEHGAASTSEEKDAYAKVIEVSKARYEEFS